jgi:hypothetical protein
MGVADRAQGIALRFRRAATTRIFPTQTQIRRYANAMLKRATAAHTFARVKKTL